MTTETLRDALARKVYDYVDWQGYGQERFERDLDAVIAAARAEGAAEGLTVERLAVALPTTADALRPEWRMETASRILAALTPAAAPTPVERCMGCWGQGIEHPRGEPTPVERCAVAGCTDPTNPLSTFHTCRDAAPSQYHRLHDVYCHPFTPEPK